FRYRIEGLDEQWTEAGSRRTAYFSHLPSGDYTFRVIAANSDGIWNVDGRTIRVVIVPPFWRTWWFMTLCAIVLCGAVILIWRYRLGQIKRAQALQEAFSRQLIASQ